MKTFLKMESEFASYNRDISKIFYFIKGVLISNVYWAISLEIQYTHIYRFNYSMVNRIYFFLGNFYYQCNKGKQ